MDIRIHGYSNFPNVILRMRNYFDERPLDNEYLMLLFVYCLLWRHRCCFEMNYASLYTLEQGCPTFYYSGPHCQLK